MINFTNSPSFYREEQFSKYLAETSFYKTLQMNVIKLIHLCKPKSVLELGSGTGATAIKIATQMPKTKIVAVDIRPDIIQSSNALMKTNHLSNLNFIQSDMTKYCSDFRKYDLIYFLYAFHHIPDSIETRQNVITNCINMLNDNGYIIIADVFLPEEISHNSSQIKTIWSSRSRESFCSTFWAKLDGLNSDSIATAYAVAKYSEDNEYRAGELVAKRENEFVITRSRLIEIGCNHNLNLVLSESINLLGDSIVLFEKR